MHTINDHLKRIAEQDRRVRAFVCVGTADDPPNTAAEIPLGVKDLFDVAGLPTGLGTATLPARKADRTAPAVTALQRWGAVVVGKTVTSEFAYFGAQGTRNPWNPAHSPGGSSTGSAAAVAAGEVPLAIGTQTNGSVIRPASFCGVVGFKPSYGTISVEGTFVFSPSFDTVGSFARSVRLAGLAADVMAEGTLGYRSAAEEPTPDLHGMRIGLVRTSDWSTVTEPMRQCLTSTADVLADHGATISETVTPLCGEETLALHKTISEFEGYRSLRRLGLQRLDLLGDRMAEFVREAALVRAEDYEAALLRRDELLVGCDRRFAELDALITVPAAGEAPLAGDNGDPRFCTRWSVAGTPALCLPAGFGPSGLPLGIQLVGRRGTDAALLRWATGIEDVLGFSDHYARLP